MMMMRFDHVSLLFFIFSCFMHSQIATVISDTDTMLYGDRISLSNNLVSSKGVFELGFFKPGSSGNNYYVGIWYKKVSKLTVVWIANRNYPISGGTGVFRINGDGNLEISDGKFFYVVTNTTSSKVNTSVTLLDSGNLVLRDSKNVMLWQSFDYPSHALLPGMKFGFNRRTGTVLSLVSWRSPADPGTGEFSVQADTNSSQFCIMKGSEIYWTSGIWNGKIFSLMPEMRLNDIYNFSYTSNEYESYFIYNVYNASILALFRMDVSGQVRQSTWLESAQEWSTFWAQPRTRCEVYASCGPFSVCNLLTNPSCQCLKGFEPLSSQEWRQGDRSSGCTREVPLLCENTTSNNGDEDKFLKMPDVRLPVNSIQIIVTSGNDCSFACLSNCNCSAYAYNGSGGCSIWNEGLLNLQQLELGTTYGDTIFVKLAASMLAGSRGNKINKMLLLVIIPVVAFLLMGCCYGYQRRNKRKQKGSAEPGQNILLFDMSFSSPTTNEEISDKIATAGGINNDSGLPLFTFVSVSAATDNFSAKNKLGEGGFGPVFKGKLLKGHEIAVKRLSKQSGQGLEEFKNEAVLIAKLQHRNLVKLLGCSLEHDEKILIYEFMPNKSLDNFLFDPIKRSLLDWNTRVRIVEGIAQGLLYLHQYSRLKIIHRDLKASNILLDADMNPKISDFGMARIFGGNEAQANTNRVVGTYGYMPPEYAMEGIFSVKTDVYSFGVLLLEIVSGKKNTGFYHSDYLNLLGYTWDLWKHNRALDLKDPVWEAAAEEEMSKNIVMRYIHVALLCVQEKAEDRPIMAEVVSMLTNESSLLPSPKQPAFSTSRTSKTLNNATINKPEECSVNEVTVSLLAAR